MNGYSYLGLGKLEFKISYSPMGIPYSLSF